MSSRCDSNIPVTMVAGSSIGSTGAAFSIVMFPIPKCKCHKRDPDNAGSDDEWRIEARWALQITRYASGLYNSECTKAWIRVLTTFENKVEPITCLLFGLQISKCPQAHRKDI